MLNYTEIPPEHSFRPFVRKFWVLDNIDNILCTPEKYTLPNGCFTIAFITGTGLTWQNEYGISHIADGVYIIGQTTKRLKISLLPHTKAIMAQLNPWAASLITGLTFSELTDACLSFEYLDNNIYKQLDGINKLDEQIVIAQFYKIIGPFFNATYKIQLTEALCSRLSSGIYNPLFTMDNLAAYAGYTKRHIEKLFNKNIGISPMKLYAILRMRSLVSDIDSTLSLSQLYYKYGYYDQSHFIKSYSKIMDSPPTSFKSDQYILPFSFNS